MFELEGRVRIRIKKLESNFFKPCLIKFNEDTDYYTYSIL